MPTPTPKQILKDLKSKQENYWLKRGENMALKLFKQMAARVPAYKDFLKKQKINPDKIKSGADFSSVPVTSKDTYLRRYPLEQLCWDGKFSSKQWVIAATSGSTGEPFYFPRTSEQDRQYALLAELYLKTNFQIDKKSTLYINAFALGIWIGGLFTYQAIKLIADTGQYHLSIINPGLNKNEILNAVKKFGGKFDQIIIGGYPPFVKEVLDEGVEKKINWKKNNLKFVFSAESFTENFRDYILNLAGASNPYLSTLNHYGTVDQGTLAYETPISVLIRRLEVEGGLKSKPIFSDSMTQPTLAQYLPEMFYFQEERGRLICSSQSGIPLFRYDLKDKGGIIHFEKMTELFSENGVDLKKECINKKISETVWKLPFVYVYERSDMVVSWYGANIYPQHIKESLLLTEQSGKLTGKFSSVLERDKNHNPFLHVNIELKKNVQPTANLSNLLTASLVRTLLEKNSEFRNNYSTLPKKNTPKITLWPYKSSPYFKGGGKQKWTIK
ncbi:MAG: phenylacetate--CoA ligase family protein [Candidatus Doudnabacteria bacterium]|nr:phenylacetate--CoA ligase family protein [Candidatus Doudnabacteria bacterium]